MTSKTIIPPFFRCQFRKSESSCLGIVLISSILLQLDPVLHSGFGKIILIGMAAISWLTPFSGFAYIAAAQALPIPADSLMNPAQVGFYTWLLIVPLRYKRYSLKGWKVILVFLPWLLWFWLITGQTVFDPLGEYAKAIYYGIIGVQLANEAKGEYLKCLMGLCLGCLTVSFGYWASQLGLPVSLSEFGGVREGFIRLGGVRADSVMIWPPLLMGYFGFLGVVFTVVALSMRNLIPKKLLYAVLIIVFISVPCLIATMTNGAVAGFCIMTVFLLFIYFNPRYGRYISGQNKSILRKTFVISLFIIGIMVSMNMFDVSSRIFAITDFYKIQSSDLGVAASRTDVWEQAVQLMFRYPLHGVLGSGYGAYIPNIGGADNSAQFLAHNVFLDYGWQVGFPGLILLALAFLTPVYLLIKNKNWFPFTGFLCFYFACFIFWMVLSFQFYKTFWAFWTLFCVAIYRFPQKTSGPAKRLTIPRHKIIVQRRK